MAIDFKAMMKQAELEMAKKLSIAEENNVMCYIDESKIPEKDFEEYKISALPNTCYYVPEFIDNNEAEKLIKFFGSNSWIELNDRKLKNYGGVPHLNGTILEPLPLPLQQLGRKLKTFGAFKELPDQALVNQYDSYGGIGFHKDGPNFKSKAAILSLQSSCIIYFKETLESDKSYPVLLEPNSLFVFTDDLFIEYYHGIPCNLTGTEIIESPLNKEGQVKLIRAPRISVTIRNVSKVKYKMTSEKEVLPPHLQEERIRRLDWWKRAVNRK